MPHTRSRLRFSRTRFNGLRPCPAILAALLLTAASGLAAQTAASRPAVGNFDARDFSAWTLTAQGPVAAGLAATVTILSSPLTRSDGSAWMPLAVGTPLLVTDGSLQEVVKPQSVDCSLGSGICRFTATFTQAHAGRFQLSSATGGLQEAVNQAPAGSVIHLDARPVTLYAPVVIPQSLRLAGTGEEGSILRQVTPGVDGIQIGSSTAAPSDDVLDNLEILGPFASPGAAAIGVGIHCVNCVRLKIQNTTVSNWATGVFFDSSYGHAFTNDILDSHLINNYIGVQIQGGSANRLTFVGNTVDSNGYGVLDDGGWVHTWIGNDIEANSLWGYYSTDTQPASYSQHNINLYGNYFEGNGANSGQGDVFLGANGASGAGCNGCLLEGNIFNASTGGNVAAVTLGNFRGNLEANIYSGYANGKQVISSGDPTHGYTWALSLGDSGVGTPGTISRVDGNGGLTLGGNDNSISLHDTVVESPTHNVIIRGQQGGAQTSNFANLDIDAQSLNNQSSFLTFSNQLSPLWTIQPDLFAQNVHDICLLKDATSNYCQAYFNAGHWQFANGVGAVPHVPAGDFSLSQVANGDTSLLIQRNTDTAPSGFLLDLVNNANTAHLFSVDTGGVLRNGSINTQGSVNAVALMQNGVRVLTPNDLPLSGQTGSILGQNLAAYQCASSALAISGASPGMVAVASPESDPGAGLIWQAFVNASGSVLIRLCNATNASVTSTASVYDVRVLR